MEEIVKRIVLSLLFMSVAVAIAYCAASDTIALPDEAVSKRTLENGLSVLSKHCPPADLIVIDINIRAGSSLEGEYMGSGISHLLEHMVFKGTSSRSAGAIEKEVKSYGGTINGYTSHDMTVYSLILPSKYLSQGLAMLKDMLLNASIRDDELAKEKEVVLKEIRMNNDEPQSRLARLMYEKAYISHSYRFPTIGYEGVLDRLTANDLKKYYNTRYVPNRMVITIVGDINESDAIAAAEKEFSDFRGPDYSISDIIPDEPAQIQPRSANERMETSLAYLAMGYHSTGILNDDLFAMDILSMILGRGDNSRLNAVLHKNKGLVHTISSSNYTPRDPGLLVIAAMLDKDKLDEAEKNITDQIALIRKNLVSDEELESAKRMIIADFISTLETIDGRANNLSSNLILTGSERFSSQYVKSILSVTKEGVKKVANKYLPETALTTVRILPKNIEEPSVVTEGDRNRRTVTRTELPNGLKLIVREDDKIPNVNITAALLGGSSVESPENNGLSNLTAEMILQGTVERPDSGKIIGEIQALGGDIDVFCGANISGITISVLRTDIDTALETLKDVLFNATFPERELDKKKSVIMAAIAEQDEDIFDIGINALKKELFAGSPYELRNMGREGSVSALKREDLLAFYKKYYRPNNMVIAVSGDVNADHVTGRIVELFSDMKMADPEIPQIKINNKEITKTVTIDLDKEQSLIMLGFRTVSRKSSDVYSLEVLNSVMGGFSGRIFAELRAKRSLSYALGCGEAFWADTGMFTFYAATQKDKLAEAKKALISEISKIKLSGISDSELSQAKLELLTRRQISAQAGKFFTYNFAGDELYGLGYDNIFKYAACVDKVTKEDVNRAANDYFDLDRCVEVIISPSGKK